MKATWIQGDGTATTLEVKPGISLMEAATAKGVPLVIGECGGSMSCATCHVVVDAAWAGKVGAAGGFEDQMLDITETSRQPTSRLSCQIRMSADLDGIVLHVPRP
jgi:ferredoxin, 2Fe-2S